MNYETILASVITALLTFWGTKKQTEYQLKEKKAEVEANTEGMYVQNMAMILAEYKEQVSGFRDELRQVKSEFAIFREEHYRKMDEYKVYVKELEEENEELRDENTELKEQLAYMEGEKHEINR